MPDRRALWHRGAVLITDDRPAVVSATGALAPALGVGVLAGIVTNLLQAVVPDPFSALVNAGAPWVTVGFVLAALRARRDPSVALGALVGATGQVGLVFGYYAWSAWVDNLTDDFTYAVFWTVVAVLAGPVFGAAGVWWRVGTGWRRIAGPALLAAVFGAEACHYALVLGYPGQTVLFTGLAVLTVLALPRTWGERGRCAATAAALTLVGFGALWAMGTVFGALS